MTKEQLQQTKEWDEDAGAMTIHHIINTQIATEEYRNKSTGFIEKLIMKDINTGINATQLNDPKTGEFREFTIYDKDGGVIEMHDQANLAKALYNNPLGRNAINTKWDGKIPNTEWWKARLDELSANKTPTH